MSKGSRKDNRTHDEFVRDIKDRTLEERALFMLWLDLQERETGTRPSYEDTGCGQHGEYLEDEDVSLDADFSVDGIGSLEVKFSRPLLKRNFHLKVSQVNAYIKQNASLLMVNGASEDVPEFTIISPEALQDIKDSCPIVRWQGFGGKASYRIDVKQYVWRPLK